MGIYAVLARIAYVAKYAFSVLFLFAKIFICAIFHAFSISARAKTEWSARQQLPMTKCMVGWGLDFGMGTPLLTLPQNPSPIHLKG